MSSCGHEVRDHNFINTFVSPVSLGPGVPEVGEGTWSREATAWAQIHSRTAALHRLCTGIEAFQLIHTTVFHYSYMLNHFSGRSQLE